MRMSSESRRPGAVLLAAGVLLGTLLGLTACGAEGGDRPALPSSVPSAGRPPLIDRPSATPDDRESQAETVTPPTRNTRTPEETATPKPTRTATTQPTAQPPAPTTARTTTPTQTTARTPAATKTSTRPAEPTAAASSLSGTAASDTSDGLGAIGWFLLIILVAGLIGGVLIWRSRRSTGWAAEADALAADTRAVVGRRLPQVLATVTAAQRALSWPPVRADLVDRVGRWALLTENAPGEQRADWSRQVWGLLQEVVTAVDAENEALATGQEWRLLRPRVEDATRALTAALAARQGPGPDTPAA
jgi:hypothetical protein